MMLTDIYTLE